MNGNISQDSAILLSMENINESSQDETDAIRGDDDKGKNFDYALIDLRCRITDEMDTDQIGSR